VSSVSSVLVINGPLFLADHGALDFINTLARAEGHLHDFWQHDDDVIAWLRQSGLVNVPNKTAFAAGALLAEALTLRETIRKLVQQKKAGETMNLAPLNQYLASASSHKQLVEKAGKLSVERVYASETPAQLLAPIAELAASLLADAHFERVRECEHPECCLWFYDRTKSHRRRWCSMALCGNRAKVARFRQQKRG